jgi:hypothetical protein
VRSLAGEINNVTNEILNQSAPRSKAESLIATAAGETIAEFKRRGLPRVGLASFIRGSWSVLVGRHPELAPLRDTFTREVDSAFPDHGQGGFFGGTR